MSSNEYMRQYMIKRWHVRRTKAIEQLGGKCVECGTTNHLQFDHKDSSEKSFTLSKASSCSEAKWQEELKKCQLLCESCHLEKSISQGDLGDRHRNMNCNCGAVFSSIRAYAGHKRWCSTGG